MGQKYADGLERVELYVFGKDLEFVAKPPEQQRVPVTLITRTGRYRAGMRTYPRTGDVYICPDLVAERDDRKTSLAKVLKDLGVKPDGEVQITIDGATLTLL